MRKTLFLTAANRPHYFREVMDSWRKVRGFYDWNVIIRLEPSDFVPEHMNIIAELQHEKLQVIVNPHVYGVLHHPWVGFNDLFQFSEFVVRAEDDLIVSDDILEYFEWASEHYRDDPNVAAVIGFTPTETPGDISSAERTEYFSPWVWGTWEDRWSDYIRDTWDHDYSTYNGFPGNEAGWDWNLNTRVLPSLGKVCVRPHLSRVQNIGVYGVHGSPQNFVEAAEWFPHLGPVDYEER